MGNYVILFLQDGTPPTYTLERSYIGRRLPNGEGEMLAAAADAVLAAEFSKERAQQLCQGLNANNPMWEAPYGMFKVFLPAKAHAGTFIAVPRSTALCWPKDHSHTAKHTAHVDPSDPLVFTDMAIGYGGVFRGPNVEHLHIPLKDFLRLAKDIYERGALGPLIDE